MRRASARSARAASASTRERRPLGDSRRGTDVQAREARAQRGAAERRPLGDSRRGTGLQAREARAQRGAAERSGREDGSAVGTRGFTLLEVLIAMFVLALAIGGLITAMAQSFQKLADARQRLEQLELAEAQVRELDANAQSGALPELGHSSGTFDPPYERWAWDLVVEPWSLPLPEGYGGQGLPSSVFQPSGTSSPVQPSVRLVSYRVYPVDGSPDAEDPFVSLAVERVPPELIAEAAARTQQAGAQTDSQPQPPGSDASNPTGGARQ